MHTERKGKLTLLFYFALPNNYLRACSTKKYIETKKKTPPKKNHLETSKLLLHVLYGVSTFQSCLSEFRQAVNQVYAVIKSSFKVV